MVKQAIDPAASATNNGSWGEWDDIWNESVGTDNAQVYINGPAKTPRQFGMQSYFEDLWHLMGERASEARYLELGSGRGTISMYLASKGCDVTLVDLSETGLELAKRHFKANGLPEPKIIRADARDTKIAEGSFDCVFNIGLLEHFEDPVPVLQESCRLLCNDGLLFSVIVPDVPQARRWPMQFVLNPLMTSYRIARMTASRLLKGRGGDSSMVRTDFTRHDWLEMMSSIGGNSASCIPYNAYHRVYETQALEQAITLPLIRTHHRIKRRCSSYPLMRTNPLVARADLLYATRTDESESSH